VLAQTTRYLVAYKLRHCLSAGWLADLTKFRESPFVSTTALHIIELLKSLPLEDQQVVRKALAAQRQPLANPKRRQLQRLADGSFHNPDGIPNDHRVFQILAQIEEGHHPIQGFRR
jgi:hypothetical protein